MPELPEVETAKRGIEQAILNKTIADLKIAYRSRGAENTLFFCLPGMLRRSCIWGCQGG
jgi:formamidopyrimidine-DNA glycosylase